MKEHIRKKIDGKFYSTKKAERIHNYHHNTGEPTTTYVKTLYKQDGQYFVRVTDFMCDYLKLTTEEEALDFFNKTKSVI
jgi:hypothetical protein